MDRCEDYPCCGHDICPSFDEFGRQIDMRCVCGARVPLSSFSSLCPACLPDPDDPNQFLPGDEDPDYFNPAAGDNEDDFVTGGDFFENYEY